MNVALIESPYANVANIARALRHAGAELRMTRDCAELARAPKIVLPGVGSFAAAMRWLEETRIDTALRDALSRGATLLGICVGHQLLFDRSNEMGTTRGLGFVRGEVVRFEGALPVPQIGWNRVSFFSRVARTFLSAPPDPFDGRGQECPRHTREVSPLFEGIADGTSFYFVNSYAAVDADAETARADYGRPFTAAVDARVSNGRVFGVQFHPEKSSDAGLRVLRNFVELAA